MVVVAKGVPEGNLVQQVPQAFFVLAFGLVVVPFAASFAEGVDAEIAGPVFQRALETYQVAGSWTQVGGEWLGQGLSPEFEDAAWNLGEVSGVVVACSVLIWVSLVQCDTFVTPRDLVGDLAALAVAGLRCMEIEPVGALVEVEPDRDLTEEGPEANLCQCLQHHCYHQLHPALATDLGKETYLLKGQTETVCSDSVDERESEAEAEAEAAQPGSIEAGLVLK